MTDHSLDFSFAFSPPIQTALFRYEPQDFIVDEQMDEAFSGEGEHFWLRVRKIGENTDWVASKLADYFSVKNMDVGYGGKKDRHAVTTQWFSIYLPGKEHRIDWDAFVADTGVQGQLLESHTHSRKLRKGEHSANQFIITLRELTEDADLLERLASVAKTGVPNYFGEQRFGRGGQNLVKVERWVHDPRSVRDRGLRGMLMSSARSYLFNLVLSQRLADGSWLQSVAGDPGLKQREADEADTAAPEVGDAGIIPTGPLWGRGRSLAQEELLNSEAESLEPYSHWCDALENVGLLQERRALLLSPQKFSWRFVNDNLELSMTLAPGQYATSVLREIALLRQEYKNNQG